MELTAPKYRRIFATAENGPSKQRGLPVIPDFPLGRRRSRGGRRRLRRQWRNEVRGIIGGAVDRGGYLVDLEQVFRRGAIKAAAVAASTPAQSSQRSNASGAITTGMRSWIGASRRFAVVVTMQAVSNSSPFGPIQVSHSPANATGAALRVRTQNARLRPTSDFHS
jgi:hypothetical protein